MKFKPGFSAQLPTQSFLERNVQEPFLRFHEPEPDIEIPYEVRDRHIFIAGMTRHGKSTLIENMALQDIENGEGVCLIDPKGDSVKNILARIPESRKNDCIYINLSTPIPMDFMSYEDPDEKEALVGNLKYILHKVGFAPRMEGILYNVIYTLFEANDHLPAEKRATFLDIYNFFRDPECQRRIIDALPDDSPMRLEWKKMPSDEAIAPILNRMTPFVRTESLRAIFGAAKPELHITDVMNERKILLVDLGGIGESKQMFGSLLVAKIQQSAFRRHSIPIEERVPFHLYIDEFQNFQTEDNAFENILSMAGGFGLRLTLANQYVNQLSSEVKGAVLGNVSTYILFKLGGESAHVLSEKVLPYEWQALTALPPHYAMFAIPGREVVIAKTPPPAPRAQISYAEDIKKRTVKKYACNSSEVRQDERNEHRNTGAKPEPEPSGAPGLLPSLQDDKSDADDPR